MEAKMPIRLAPEDRATAKIDPVFIEVLHEVWERQSTMLQGRVRRLMQRYENASGVSRQRMQKEILHMRNQLLLHRQTGSGVDVRRGGLDYQVTRLKRLPYEVLTIKNTTEDVWMIARTGPISTDFTARTQRSFKSGVYDHGPYYVCIGTRSLGTLLPLVHILPVQDPRELNRHMHHCVRYEQYEPGKPPLEQIPATCWGAFAGVIPTLFEDCDVASIFDYLYKYAANINPEDALRSVDRLPYVTFRSRS
jgi:hypothetical protein